MADINSDVIAQLEGDPLTPVDVRRNGGRLRTKIGLIEHAGAQGDGDVMRFFRIRSGDRITKLQLTNDALTGALDTDFGLHGINAGAAVSDGLFDTAQTLASALVRQEKRFGANSALNLDTLPETIWELLGLTEDPHLEYDVTGTMVDAGTASGTVVLEVEYTAGD